MIRRFLIPAALLLFPIGAIRANELSWRSLQSGSAEGPAAVHDRGLRGEGEIIAILDTGLDYDHCDFAENDGSPPPLNLPALDHRLPAFTDPTRRKVIAYNFLYSCSEYPAQPGCDDPANPKAYDNQGHGTRAAGAAAGDRGAPIFHDYGDSLAPGAKLVIQDAGLVLDAFGNIVGDACTHRPGLRCPVRDLRPVLQQAYDQGARIHSNSWGDRQGVPLGLPAPTGNYSPAARDIDDFVFTHPDMVMVFNTGNTAQVPFGVSSPGSAKNTIQVGGTRGGGRGDDYLFFATGFGPTRDGRIKPDLVGPASVLAPHSDFDVTTGSCNRATEGGTSWSSPTVAGAIALVRQYYREGFYPAGSRNSATAMNPSAALVKATLIAAARRVPFATAPDGSVSQTLPVPSYEQGFGFPVLDDALYFAGDRRSLRIADLARESGLRQGESFETSFSPVAGSTLRAVLVWTDPPGTAAPVSDATPQLMNDLDLRVIDPAGRTIVGNATLNGDAPDRLNNAESISIESAVAGRYRIIVRADRLGSGTLQGFALVVTGEEQARRRRLVRR